MADSASTLNLSFEELAFAIGAIGENDVAAGFLRGLLGMRTKEEIDGRLLAASHSLIARGLMTPDFEKDEPVLDPVLADYASVMARCDYSIRCGRSTDDGEDVLTLFVKGDNSIAHRIHLNVVSQISAVASLDDSLPELLGFAGLEPTGKKDEPLPESLGTLKQTILAELATREAPFGVNDVRSLIESAQTDLPEEIVEMLVASLCSVSDRVGIARIEIRDGEIRSDQGLLLLRSGKALWALVLDPSTPEELRVYQATPAAVVGVIQGLMT